MPAASASWKRVLIGVPFNLYSQSNNQNRFREIESLRDQALPYYLSTLVTRAGVLTVGSALAGTALKSEAPDMSKEQFWQSQLGQTTARYYSNWRAPLGTRGALRDIADHCRENGIQLAFFIPPTHVDLQEKINAYELSEEYESYLAFLSSLAPVLDFDFPNSTTRDRNAFKDPYHAVQAVNRRVVSVLMSDFQSLSEPDFVIIR